MCPSALLRVSRPHYRNQIAKSLTEPPEAYPYARSQPHVKVALRLQKLGYTSGCSAGDTVPYIICCEQWKGSSTSVAQQIHPVVSRLCAYIEGTSPSILADCLGLDPSKIYSCSIKVANNDHSGSVIGLADDEERYMGCKP
nr:DNA polymerase alpha catalytic subunit [Tanacetum cinerariifolium]